MSGLSATRTMVAELRARLDGGPVLAPPPPLPRIEAPPARVYVPRREGSPFAREAARHTTALVGIGHVGTRYATDVVLQFQAELAVAHQAVAAELADDFAEREGFLPLRSRCADHREFLLRPDLGRRLDDESLARLRREGVKGVDDQLVLADGLSAVACQARGPALFAAVRDACKTRGLTVGTPVCARFARVWLEDEIGQEVGAKVAIILLGERPGLGTGDGLSAYAVYEPRLGKTDGDRNMMSNLHPRGTPIDVAAVRLAALAQAMIAQRTSGVTLELSRVEGGAGGRSYRAPEVRQRLVDRTSEPTGGDPRGPAMIGARGGGAAIEHRAGDDLERIVREELERAVRGERGGRP
jgi:ethanolamine ammonia-lyase small subunit